jgi:hypothetical protein
MYQTKSGMSTCGEGGLCRKCPESPEIGRLKSGSSAFRPHMRCPGFSSNSGRFPAGQIAPYVIAPTDRRGCRLGATVCNCERRCRLRRQRRVRLKRLWGAFAGPIQPGRVLHHGSGDDDDVSLHHYGATHGKAPAGFAPLAIGLALVMIHLVSIPVTNTSVNPARSTGPALFVGGWTLEQLWLFWLAPLVGVGWVAWSIDGSARSRMASLRDETCIRRRAVMSREGIPA